MGSYRDIAEELILSDFSKVREYIPRKRCRPRSEEEEFEARWNGNGREIKWSLRLLPPGTKLRTTRSSLLDLQST